ncbi:MAG TPA: hypothetical protein VGF45_16810 [Polyangia bacterium]
MKLGKHHFRSTSMGRVLGLAGLFVAASAQAQPAAGPPPAGQAAAPAGSGEQQQGPAVKVERGAGGKTVYRITEAIRIEGKIQKPEAFYVLQKSSINYDWQDLKQDFVPKIVDSVSRAPF